MRANVDLVAPTSLYMELRSSELRRMQPKGQQGDDVVAQHWEDPASWGAASHNREEPRQAQKEPKGKSQRGKRRGKEGEREREECAEGGEWKTDKERKQKEKTRWRKGTCMWNK